LLGAHAVNESEVPQNVYIDTNALRSLNFRAHIAPLLFAAQTGLIRLSLCETVLWERARQYHEMEATKDRLIMLASALPKVVAWFRKVFEDHGVAIVRTEQAHRDEVQAFLSDGKMYFRAGNGNDVRDALIFAVARLTLPKEGTLILCQEKLLSAAFQQDGYTVREDAKQYVEEIVAGLIVPQMIPPDISVIGDYGARNALSPHFRELVRTADASFEQYERELPADAELLTARLANMAALDQEIRRRILGYASWFDPVSKADLGQLLSTRYDLDLVRVNAQRLREDGLLVETEDYWLINQSNSEARQVGEQAKGSVMPEILVITGLN
jgi:hypothetical protein